MATLKQVQNIDNEKTGFDGPYNIHEVKVDLPDKQQNGTASSEMDLGVNLTKRTIIRNLILLSFAFLLNFTAFQTTSNLQSTLNARGNLGTHSLIAVYSALVVSCFFLPRPVIYYLGYKWTLVASLCCYLTFIAAQFYPKYYTFIPTALLVGIGAAPLWSAKCSYLTDIGAKYAELTGEKESFIITRFFGIFFTFFQFSGVVGNVISSQVLVPDNTSYSVPQKVLDQCGAKFCPDTYDNANFTNPNLERPDERKIYILSGIFVGCAVLAVILIALLLTNIKCKKEEGRSGFDAKLFIATLIHLRHPEQILIIPLTMYSGLEQSFIVADFTEAFIGCALGIWQIGLVLICYAAVDSIMSFSTGHIVKYTGRVPVFIAGGAVNIAIIIVLLLWTPKSNQSFVFYLVAAGWGFCDAIWQTQINALYGCLFGEESDAAFSNYRMWESLGFIIAFAYQGEICASLKLYIVLGFLLLGLIGYACVEWMQRGREKATKE